MKRIDLHTHSNASDGSMSPKEVMVAAKAAGLSAVALTDHDTIVGIPEALAAAEILNIECIPGIELSAFYKGLEVHIVGLFLNIHDSTFQKRLQSFQDIRNARNLQMLQKMQNAGVSLSLDDFLKNSENFVLTRAHLAQYLLHIGYVSSIAEAFDKYLSPGMPFYVPKTGVSPKDCIEAIRENGGIAILAHPLTYQFRQAKLTECLNTLKGYGLQGMETYYSTFSDADHRAMSRLAKAHGLLASGGSDFHGAAKPHIHIGTGMGRLVIPYDVLDTLREHLCV